MNPQGQRDWHAQLFSLDGGAVMTLRRAVAVFSRVLRGINIQIINLL